jgi:hypothetical protein
MKTRITRRYLAGLIDGEGYISIKPINRWNRQIFAPTIKMALTDKSAYILFEIKGLLGGHIYKRTYQNKNFNDAYCWEVGTFNTTKKVLDYIRPYLILKKEQANLVNELLKTKSTTISANGTFTKINPQILTKRQRLYNLVKELNKRGRLPAETKCETPTNEGEVIVQSSEKSEEVSRNTNSLDNPVLCKI